MQTDFFLLYLVGAVYAVAETFESKSLRDVVSCGAIHFLYLNFLSIYAQVKSVQHYRRGPDWTKSHLVEKCGTFRVLHFGFGIRSRNI